MKAAASMPATARCAVCKARRSAAFLAKVVMPTDGDGTAAWVCTDVHLCADTLAGGQDDDPMALRRARMAELRDTWGIAADRRLT